MLQTGWTWAETMATPTSVVHAVLDRMRARAASERQAAKGGR